MSQARRTNKKDLPKGHSYPRLIKRASGGSNALQKSV